MSILNRFIHYFKYRLKVRNSYWFSELRYHGIPLSDLAQTPEGKVKILSLNIILEHSDLIFVLKAYPMLKAILKDPNCTIQQSEEVILLSQGEISVPVDSKQEVFIFKEIFVDGIYNFHFTRPFSVIDIGFNVGMASLSFARSENVSRIYGFEPLNPTIKKAKEVLNHNSQFASKIELREYGLANEDGTFSVPYDYETKGNTAVADSTITSDHQETIQVRECASVIEEILQSEKDMSIFVKIDCEGSEYGIIEKLAERNLLRHLDVLVIEFHFRGSAPLILILEQHGFECLVLLPNSTIGMIYAWKKTI